jgi:hypothetical protein
MNDMMNDEPLVPQVMEVEHSEKESRKKKGRKPLAN